MDQRLAAMAEVHAELYSAAQLQALFDFHCSEIGRSIGATQILINKEMQRREPELNKLRAMKELNSLGSRAFAPRDKASPENESVSEIRLESGTAEAKLVGLRRTSGTSNIYELFDYKLRIFSIEEDGNETDVTVAISTRESLEVFTRRTPIEYAFATSCYYIFYDTLDKAVAVRAELYSNEMAKHGITTDGAPAAHGGSSGRGKFIRDPGIPITMSGGG